MARQSKNMMRVGELYEFRRGDEVLVKNRAEGALESKFIGPYWFVKYKDFDGYACILETEDGIQFDCSVKHVVPVDKRSVQVRVN